ncbi:MAG: creatininase family protein [Bacteroidia bacterium]|jgi:creatinine amidohydrolase|nr:creatininase family protein [Bacteroidia bacterium]
MRPYILAETNWKTVQETAYEVAILPWGATEAHNYHMPYATDNYQNEYVVEAAARQAWEAGARVLVLPNVPFGINTGQLDIAFCLNMNPSTQMALLRDLADVVVRAGVRKLVILNGHGGNNFKNMIRELSVVQPSLFACAVDWYKGDSWPKYFSDLGDHAGELETSAMLHIRPDLLRPLSEAGSGHAKQYTIKALRDGWATAQRQWTLVTDDTGVGDPRAATAEKGKAFLDVCAHRLAEFWTELARTPLDELYA